VALVVNPIQVEPNIDMESLFKKLEFVPHSKAQWDYCKTTTRFNVPCCGRRWGKSIATGHRMTYKSFIPGTYNWIVGPTYKLGEKEFRVVYKDYEKLGLLKHCKKSYNTKQGNMQIETPWNTHIEVVSAEKPDSLLGEGLSHAVMSEAAKHSRMIWEQYIEPALSDLLGSCDFPSTPQGYNWYHGLFLLGQSQEHPDYFSATYPSWTNPVRYPGGLNNAEIQRIKATVSDSYFNQEYGAKFTTFTGAIYEEWDEQVHVRPHTFNPKWQNYQAFDYGFSNPFVCLDIQVDPSENLYVWREYYHRFKSTWEHGQYLKNEIVNPPDYHVDGRWGDPRGADEAATLALVLGYVASQDTPWKWGVEEIKRMLKARPPRIYVDPSCTNLIRQMGQLHVKEQSRNSKQDLNELQANGNNVQHKVDDHAVDALRYFVGPMFALGAGTHLEDVGGNEYEGSEAHDFFTTNGGISLGAEESISYKTEYL
jgi:hypothetical protein